MKRCVGEEETCIYWQRLYPAEEKQYQREGEAPHVSQEPGASQRPLAAQGSGACLTSQKQVKREAQKNDRSKKARSTGTKE